MADVDRFALFTQTRERLGQSLVRLLDAALPDIAEAFDAAADHEADDAARRALRAGAQRLRAERDERARRAIAHLYDITFRLLELNQSRADGEEPLLTLMPQQDLDRQILADEVATAVRERLGSEHELWVRRIDALTGTVSTDVRAPLCAGAISATAVEALRLPPAERPPRATLRAAALAHLVPAIARLLADANDALAAQGVAPRERTAAETASASSPKPADAAAAGGPPVPAPRPVAPPATLDAPPTAAVPPSPPATPPPAAEAPAAGSSARDAAARAPAADDAPPFRERRRVPPPSDATPLPPAGTGPDPSLAASDALVSGVELSALLGSAPIAPSGPEGSGFRHAGALPRPASIERDAVAFAHLHGVTPYGRDARRRLFGALRERLRAAEAPPAQVAAVEVVSAMFDYVIDDARLPEAARPLVWRLQQPVATLAALDPGFLGDDRRSVRRVVENVAAIATGYADDVVLGSELYRRLDTVVRAVEVVAHAYQARSTVLGEQVQREYRRAVQGVESLVTRVERERAALESTPDRRNRRDFRSRPSKDREREVTEQLERELRERVGRFEVPPSVRDFLFDVWLRHLRTAVLRDGPDSAQYGLAMRVVDDLLWSLDGSGRRQSRRQLATRIPPLIRLLTQGMTDAGAKPETFRSFLDEMFVIHLRKMQRRPRADGEASTTMMEPPDEGGGPAREGGEDGGVVTVSRPRTARLAAPPVLDQRIDVAADAPSAGPDLRGSGPPFEPSRRMPTGARASGEGAPPPGGRGPDDAPPAGQADPAALDAPDDAGASPIPVDPLRGLGGSRPRLWGAQAPTAGATVPPIDPRADDGAAEPDDERDDRRLLDVIGQLDLRDFPDTPMKLRLEPDEAISRLRRGDWLEVVGRDGTLQEMKIAWINSRRTVVLLVRRTDRRALSLRADELQQRFAQRKAALIVSGRE